MAWSGFFQKLLIVRMHVVEFTLEVRDFFSEVSNEGSTVRIAGWLRGRSDCVDSW